MINDQDKEERSSDDDSNPLLADSPNAWDRLIESVNPASLLVVIEHRMNAGLKRRLTPEDIWQEALLHAWRDRKRCEWRGIKSFRSWLLTIIDNRIRDAVARETAAKRGGGTVTSPFSSLQSSQSSTSVFPGAITSTTPSRIMMFQEQAKAIRAVLDSLPEELRDVVRMRLLEQHSIVEIAERLGIGASAARHRFRKGAQLYRRRLATELATRLWAIESKKMTDRPPDPSSTG
ncbi:MAG: sigma-70 family RNA polymerase sigma factor [Phycisphaerae bacterium]